MTPELALSQARAAEAEIARCGYRGPLHGIPVAVKDLCFTKGIRTTGGMTIHAEFVPGYDATVVTRLAQAGAVLLGKLHMTEGATIEHHPDLPEPRRGRERLQHHRQVHVAVQRQRHADRHPALRPHR